MASPTINGGQAISYGWSSIKKDFWYFVALAFVVFIISGIGSTPHHGLNGWNLIGFLLSAWITCGSTKLFLSYFDGKKRPLEDVFTQVKYFWRVLGATVLLAIITGIGFALFIVPGIYLAVRFQFVITLIIDKDLGIMEALRASTKMTNGFKMSLLGFDLTLLGVIILGAICLGFGLLVAMPLVELATISVYRKLAVVISSPAAVS